jgi:hypothetical protein
MGERARYTHLTEQVSVQALDVRSVSTTSFFVGWFLLSGRGWLREAIHFQHNIRRPDFVKPHGPTLG